MHIQAAFGLGLDNRSEADFPDASGPGVEVRVELKIVPLKKGPNKWRVKERQVIGMINYDRLPREEWSSSHARTKMNRILNVFVTHEPKGQRHNCIVKGASIWEPDSFIDPVLKETGLSANLWCPPDRHIGYLSVSLGHYQLHEKVRWRRRHCLLHRSRAGLRRAFSLKVAYMNGIWECHSKRIGSLRVFRRRESIGIL